MGKKLLTAMLMLLCFAFAASAERIELSDLDQDVEVTVLESNEFKTVIRFDIGAFDKDVVEIDNQTYFNITAGEEGRIKIKGDPALPRICRSIIIPDNAKMGISVLSADYIDFEETPVAPSKGIITRDILPQDVPFEFGKAYENDEWSPNVLANLRDPFIMRDYRGTVVEVNAFQYHPERRVLRAYKSVTVEITNIGSGEINLFDRVKNSISLIPDFEEIYQHRFLNYDFVNGKYNEVEETGDMLIITYDSFHDAMLPLVEWKMQKGIKTTIVDVSTIGNNDVSIKNYIQSFYDSTNLAFVLLVGDAAQVDVPYSGGDSDPHYSKLAGSDDYPEIIIGRFSATTVAEVQTQVERSVDYEKTPSGSDWFMKGTGVASNEGPGDDNEYDNVHMGYIRDDLLAYGFTEVDEFYQPSATSSQVTNALNAGRSIVNYVGHGSTTSWSTTGFSNSHVNGLQNNGKLPFVYSVACVNGDFNGNTCFAEAWLRATNNGGPSGAIGTYMATINQSWDPPMDAEDEYADLLVAETRNTFGGLCYNSSCKMMATYGSAGVDMFDTWIIFGDPSIQVRVKNPQEITASHSAAHIFTMTDFDVSVPGVEGALCALYYNGVLFGSAYTDAGGNATINITGDLPIGEAITLTVTGLHLEPYIGSVQVIAPEGPFVVFDSYTIDDSFGNNDGLLNCGESVSLDMSLSNVGPDTAFDVSVMISTSDPYITITDDIESFGIIPGEFGLVSISASFGFDASTDMPNDHLIDFDLTITGSDTTWNGEFSVPGYCYPAMSADPMSFVDSMFINDSKVKALTVYNDGNAPLQVIFSCTEGWLDFAGGTQTIPAHDNMNLDVLINTSTLSYGTHYCTLDFNSNDPGYAYGQVDFTVHIYSPDIYVAETSVDETVAIDDVKTTPFEITNNGPGRLDYSLTRLMFNGKNGGVVAKNSIGDPIGYRPSDADKSSGGTEPYYAPVDRNSGGPDAWGYNWADSDEIGGPTFEWIDISTVGTTVALVDDDTTTAIPMGMSFPYYENYYSELYIGSNGIITFGEPSRNRTNQSFPIAQIPNNIISLWWDDLDPGDGGSIYYYHDAANSQFIVTFDGVPNYKSPDGTGSLTFQAILKASGQIKLQYLTMDAGEDYDGLNGASIGIENATGTDGLTVAYNAAYMHDNLAVLFTAAQWLSINPGSGSIDPFSSASIDVSFDASGMSEGTYTGQLQLNSNDPDTPYQEIPVTMTVSTSVVYVCGDVNGDETVNILDGSYLIAYLYQDGAPPVDMDSADVNNDSAVNIIDVTSLISYLYNGGSIACQ